MLSIGTGAISFRYDYAAPVNGGVLRWAQADVRRGARRPGGRGRLPDGAPAPGASATSGSRRTSTKSTSTAGRTKVNEIDNASPENIAQLKRDARRLIEASGETLQQIVETFCPTRRRCRRERGSDTRSNGGITLVTPLMKWWAVIWMHIQFRVTKICPKILGLQAFSSVYFTHWCVVKRLPGHEEGAGKTKLKRPWLLWEVSYSAAVDPYIEQFAKGIPANIKRVWGTSDGFPGISSVSRLSNYIMDLSFDLGHIYWAHPHATLRTIQSGFNVCKEHAGLVARAQAGDAERFKPDVRRVPGAAPRADGLAAARAEPDRRAHAPSPSATRRRSREIAKLDPTKSPFARINSVHMARLVVVGQVRAARGMEAPQELPGQYLLFSVAAQPTRTPSSHVSPRMRRRSPTDLEPLRRLSGRQRRSAPALHDRTPAPRGRADPGLRRRAAPPSHRGPHVA